MKFYCLEWLFFIRENEAKQLLEKANKIIKFN